MDDQNIHHLTYEDKDVTLIGTAHVSRESVELVGRIIRDEYPETVCLELCWSRYESLTHPERLQNMDLLTLIKEKKSYLLLSSLVLSYFQKKIGRKLGVKPGGEMLEAVQAARAVGARIHLVDRDVRVTLSRAWRLMGLRSKIRLLGQLITSVGELDSIKEEDIENLKKNDMLEAVLEEVGDSLPELRRVLIDERDQYLAYRIRTAPGNRIVAVVGAGHIPGILKYWEQPIDTESLDRIPTNA
jgi:pheromone shutdown-related protein TraB